MTYNGTVRGVRFSVGANLSYARSRYISPYNPLYGNSLLQYRNSLETAGATSLGYEVVGQFQSMDEINNYTVNNDGQGNKTMLPGDLIYKDTNGDGIINQSR